MTLSDQFGENITADEIEDSIVATLREWMPSYVMAMEVRKGVTKGAIAAPRQWQVTVDENRWTADQLPAINVVSAGTNDRPAKARNGTYDASFLTAVVWFIGGQDRDTVRRTNRWYAAIIREVLIQHAPKVAGVSVDVDWLGEEYDTVSSDASRTLAGGRNVFAVTVVHVVERDAGPLEPVADPYAPDAYPDQPTVDSVEPIGEIMED